MTTENQPVCDMYYKLSSTGKSPRMKSCGNGPERRLGRKWPDQGRWSSQRGEFSDKFYTVKEVGKETEVLNLEAEGVLSSFYSTLQ